MRDARAEIARRIDGIIPAWSITYRAGIDNLYSDSSWNLSRVLPNDLYKSRR
jgi:hypothetical protein